MYLTRLYPKVTRHEDGLIGPGPYWVVSLGPDFYMTGSKKDAAKRFIRLCADEIGDEEATR